MGLKDITGWGQAGLLIADDDISINANIQRAKLGTRTMYVGVMPSSMQLEGSGCVSGFTGVYSHVIMPNANTSAGYAYIPLPDDYDSGDITFDIHWLTVATAGNAKFSLSISCVSAGDVLASEETDTITDTAAGTTLLLNLASITIAAAVFTGGKLIAIKISRDPADVQDTLAADLRLVGLRLSYTARG